MENYYKEFVLTQEELDHLSKIASEVGIRAYQNEQKRQQRAADNAHRMKQALKSYRDIKQIIMAGEEAPSGMGRDTERSKELFSQIDRAAALYRQECERSGNPEAMRRFHEMEKMYITEQICTVQEIAQEQQVSDKTIYKDLGIAAERMAFYFGPFNHE